jgi:hypothetical protein
MDFNVDTSWDRPNAGCASPDGPKPYQEYTLTNTGGADAFITLFTSGVDEPDVDDCPVDMFLHAFSQQVDPLDPTASCLTGNDDGGPGTCGLLTRTLAAGATEIIVVSTFGDNPPPFDYQLNAVGTGSFTLDPL